MTRGIMLLGIFVLLYGCASSQTRLDEYTNEWLTRPLSELKQSMNGPGSYASKIGWKEKTYPLANGNSVFVEPWSKDCAIQWEISPEGIIVGSRPVGSGCEQGSSSNTGLLQRTTAPNPDTLWH